MAEKSFVPSVVNRWSVSREYHVTVKPPHERERFHLARLRVATFRRWQRHCYVIGDASETSDNGVLLIKKISYDVIIFRQTSLDVDQSLLILKKT